jgi:hypothetical protein
VVVGVGSLLLGVVLLVITRATVKTPFWQRKPELADPAVLDD